MKSWKLGEKDLLSLRLQSNPIVDIGVKNSQEAFIA